MKAGQIATSPQAAPRNDNFNYLHFAGKMSYDSQK
jgi:hypothetical protein